MLFIDNDVAVLYTNEKPKERFIMSCCCSEKQTDKKTKKLFKIEYLYLDLKTCDRCMDTDKLLDEVVEVLKPALQLAGYEVRYRKHEMTTAQIAQKFEFVSSPTIRVNGRDIFDVVETDCGCCGDIAGVAVDCRAYEYDGKVYDVPSKQLLAKAILKSIDKFAPCNKQPYEMPDNLKRFFEGKANKNK